MQLSPYLAIHGQRILTYTAIVISPCAAAGDTTGGYGIRTQENSAYLPSTNFSLAINEAYATNVGIAPEIETEENIAYQQYSEL